jgi:hypothetical protein
VKEYQVTIKDEDGQIYVFDYHDLRWEAGQPLLLYKYMGLKTSGAQDMRLIARFENARAIHIGEVEDES